MTDSTLQNLILNTPALKALAIAGQDADILAQVPTCAPQVTTPKPFQASDIMGCVVSSDRAKVATSAMYYAIQVAVQSQDRVSVANEAQLCVDAALITPAEQTAINAVLAATVSGPDTSVTDVAQVSRVLSQFRTNGRAGQANWTGA